VPLTPIQKDILRVIAGNRTPESHVAGGAAINRGESGIRYSDDLDIFHDAAASVAASADFDADALRGAGFAVEWAVRSAGFAKAKVSRGDEVSHLDWASDTAFRFFPVQPDEEFGFCLHRADLTVNKVLALAGRNVIRDYLDVIHLDQTYMSFGAAVWAACGKDPGWTPNLLLDLTNRHSPFQPADLEGEHLARPLDIRELKLLWLAARERAERLFSRLAERELGCLYLGPDNAPVTPDPDGPGFASLIRHHGRLRGSWPTLS